MTASILLFQSALKFVMNVISINWGSSQITLNEYNISKYVMLNTIRILSNSTIKQQPDRNTHHLHNAPYNNLQCYTSSQFLNSSSKIPFGFQTSDGSQIGLIHRRSHKQAA